MELPNLPTDNLYKFTAFMGIVFVILFLIYPWVRIDKINNEKLALMAEKAELDVSLELLTSKIENLTDKAKKSHVALYDKYGNIDSLRRLEVKTKFDFNKFKKDLQNKDYREFLKFSFEYEKQLYPELVEQEEINKAAELLIDANNKSRLTSIRIASKEFQIEKKLEQERSWIWINHIGIFLGLIMIILCLGLWYIRGQKPLDEKLRIENALANQGINKDTNSDDVKIDTKK